MRRSGRERRARGAIAQAPWRLPRHGRARVEPLSADEVERIHRAALRLLRDTGVRVLYDEARRLLRAAGAEVDDASMMVRLDPELAMELASGAPAQFTLRARNPQRDLPIGGDAMVFSAIGGPAFVSDLERGRRAGTFDEQCEYLKLIQSLEVLHQEGGGPFEALDLPPESRHLDLHAAQIRLLDKNWQGIALGRERTEDGIELACIALGTDRAGLASAPALMAIVNTNTPLQYDVPMAEGTIALAEAGQATCITPFTLAGAMGPATLAGTLVLQHAEVLVGVALTQAVRRGAPVIYGAFTSNVDMRSGAPAFGTPEYAKAAMASGQLARRLSLPFRSSNTTTATSVDAQAAYESAMSLWGAMLGGANLVNHAAGWLEGGLTASFEKLVVDAEMLQMMAATLEPLIVDDDALALEAIAEVGPGGHFFGAAHTLARYESAFYRPLLSDWRNYEAWRDAGSVDATHRAATLWRQLLADYEPPPLDRAIDEAVSDYVARRKRQLHGR